MRVVIVTGDLATGSMLEHGCHGLGMETTLVRSPVDVGASCAANAADIILVDLDGGPLEARVVDTMREVLVPRGRIVAFGPHVQVEKLRAARLAGCDQVVTRGQVHRDLRGLLLGTM